jgi:16S rRNA (guanine527-N7)-methyltransferase
MGCQRTVTPLDVLRAGLERLGLAPESATLDAFSLYLTRLREANARVNLTSVRDAEGIVRRHLLESAAFGVALQAAGLLDRATRVIDVGAGAGFPGLPLRLLWPRLRLTLLDATAKKTDFLRETVAALGLRDVAVVTARAEAAGRGTIHRERYDLALSRAVAPLAVLAELTLPLLRVGGASAGMKGSRLDEEVAAAGEAIERLGGGPLIALPSPVAAEGDEPAPRFFLIRKERPTPDDLPRKSGVTSSNPLR